MIERFEEPSPFLPRTDYFADVPQIAVTHFEDDRSSPLTESENSVVNKLIREGYEVSTVKTTFYFGGSPWMYGRRTIFTQEKEYFEVKLGDDGRFRIEFESPTKIYLAMILIFRWKQGRCRYWFKKVTDALFQAGAEILTGRVAPTRYSDQPIDQDRLMKFYVRENGFKRTGGEWIKKVNPALILNGRAG